MTTRLLFGAPKAPCPECGAMLQPRISVPENDDDKTMVHYVCPQCKAVFGEYDTAAEALDHLTNPDYKAANLRLRREISKLKTLVEEKTRQIDSYKQTSIPEERQELAKLREENSELRKANALLSDGNATAKELNGLRFSLQKANADREEALKRLSKLQAAHDAKATGDEEAVEKLRSDISFLQTQKSILQSKLAEAEETIRNRESNAPAPKRMQMIELVFGDDRRMKLIDELLKEDKNEQ